MMSGVTSELSRRLVSDQLWDLARPLLPPFAARPQGGGTAPRDERAVLTAVVYVLTSDCAWRQLPAMFGVPAATAHRRYAAWTEVHLWRRLDDAAKEAGVDPSWTATIVAAADRRASSAT
ncbi:transposase [Streptomyces sp. NPDC059009]|uniref:transposase n=1 Tax=Streptomyces sp. NPDC059009 TaxID=3346694 RepID=UPI003677A9F6